MVRLLRLLSAAALPGAILAEDAAGVAADGKHSRARKICHAPTGVAE